MARSIKAPLFAIFAGGMLLAAYAPARAARQDQTGPQDQQQGASAQQTQPSGKKSKANQQSDKQLFKEIDKQYQK